MIDIFDKEAIYYIFVPLFYWGCIYGMYRIGVYFALYECIKEKKISRESELWLLLKFSGAFAFICWLVAGERSHQFGLLNHLIKLSIIFYFPSIVGVVIGYKKYTAMSEEQVRKFQKFLDR